jgi:hypothetical protein
VETDKVLEEIKDIMVERLKFSPSRIPDLSLATALTKDIEDRSGSIRSTSSSCRSASRSALGS